MTQPSNAEVQASLLAALEVLNGANQNRVLALGDQLWLARRVLAGILNGSLLLTQKPEPAAPPRDEPSAG